MRACAWRRSARSAGVFGLNAQALKALDDASDVAELGLSNLAKATIGFNVATVASVGAVAALSYKIGTLAREHIPGLEKAADDLVGTLRYLWTGEEGLGGFDNKLNAQLKQQIDQEKRALTKQWAAREKQLEAMMRHTAGVYGSIQGIIGQNTLPEIPLFELGTSDLLIHSRDHEAMRLERDQQS